MKTLVSALICVLALRTAHAQQASPPVTIQPGATVTLPAGTNPSAVAVADFDQDGRADIAVCEKGPGVAAIYLQTAGGTFPSVMATYSLGIAPTGLVAVRLDDASSRPAADLVGISGPSGRWTLLRNNLDGKATFTPASTQPYFGSSTPSANPQLVAAYIDGDRLVDFAYTYDGVGSFADYRVEYTAYQGASSLPRRAGFMPRFAPSGIAIADFDRDGLLDVATTNPLTNTFWVVTATPLGPLQPNWDSGVDFFASSGVRPTQLAAGDINADSRPDLVVANSGSNTATVFLNLGGNRFGSEVSYALSGSPRRLLLKDLNRDGYDDLLVITADNKLQIFQHTGLTGIPRYGTPQTFATGADPVTLDYVDVDGDSNEDIVVSCAGDNTVRVFLNKTFTPVTGTAPRQLFGVEAYPNPARDQLVVRGGAAQVLQATLIDRIGRTVLTTRITPQSQTIPVVDLPRGLYLLRLTDAQGSATTKRIVLE